jgi:eukaryotic-like serine/threonine-protein kinase
MTGHDRDALIRAALSPAPEVRTPADLAGDIRQAVAATAQRRPGLLAQVGRRLGPGWLPNASPRLAWLVVVIALVLGGLALVALAARLIPPRSDGILSIRGTPAQTGIMPGPVPADPPTVAWQASLGGAVSSLMSPLVYGGDVYQLDGDGTLTAFDRKTGSMLWQGSGFGTATGGPVIAGGLAVVAGDDGRVVAFDATSGALRWTTPLAVPTLVPVATWGERLFVGSDDGNVYILDRATGSQIGRLAAGGAVQRSPAIADGIVYVAAVGGHLRSFDAATGALRWKAELGDGEVSTPAVSGGVVYVARGSRTGKAPYEVVAVDARDGTVRWRWATPGHDRLFIGAVSATTVYALSEDHDVYAMDIASHVGRLFFATGGSVQAASIVGDTLFVSSADRQVYALDAVTAARRWMVSVIGVPTTPTVIDGWVFVGTDLGKLVALGGAEPARPTSP